MTSVTRTAPRRLARATQTAVAAAAVADVFRTVALRDHYLHPTDESLRRSGLISMVFVYLMTLATVLFLVWLARSRRNAQELSPEATVPGPGWTIGAWFIPVVNLFVPRRSVLDIGRAGSASWENRDTALVNLWWAAWVGHALVLTAANLAAPGSLALLVVTEALFLAAAVLVGLVIERITALQGAALRVTVPVASPQP
ncbi:DUF4328 domain-containing protein [Streptomyces sp. NPDC090499]|uniref:DUF4328 domain-containing protein n=1 Tax=Streptomyces sp. NPDC090499 TaxID=3365965 RepID=UPI00380D16BD